MLLCFSLRLLKVQLTMRETFFQHSTPPRPNPTLWLCDILRLAWLIKMSNAVHILNAVAHRRSKKKKIKHKKQNELDQEQRKMAKSNSGAIKTEKKESSQSRRMKMSNAESCLSSLATCVRAATSTHSFE